ncbi:cupin domain-containing protein [Microbacterium sp. QXD-8]|uniref:Cupin domain-containing protein n=1 Tax=Microbacterium psychrotolerans TaxID=3068321 RepID=A0ABU0Z4S2_9MICO|nr:cupin domain-containing protein [Microbacterium sp. QXD-8]MDQ7879003.1 cupin domain-containing protein [Microbacterium sp. QXD-8]
MHDHNSIYDNLEPAQRPEVQVLSSVDLAAIDGARDAMTIHVTLPPASPGTRPHRHSGPAFGYVVEGELLFELEGEAPRVVKAGETFWEPGGDVIHYQDANNLADESTTFVVTMLCIPGEPMLTLVSEEELSSRSARRVPSSS